jgi:SAM-dependent methyltransferase
MSEPAPVTLEPTACAICGDSAGATELYPSTLDAATFTRAVFSARRAPDRRHYRIVRCDRCGLVRSDPAADPSLLDRLYQDSGFSYARETVSLRLTYRRALERVFQLGAGRDALLEIGAGNGFFLQEARAAGIARVTGVEPSREAIARADPDIAGALLPGMFRAGLFPDATFDIVCLFQVFDHLPDPAACLYACLDVLKPGGYLLAVNHNVDAVSARILGSRSPIFDVEHTFLYNPVTMATLIRRCGFDVVSARPIANTLSLAHLTWLSPLPSMLKQAALALLRRSGAGARQLRLPIGNLQLIARKPGRAPR